VILDADRNFTDDHKGNSRFMKRIDSEKESVILPTLDYVGIEGRRRVNATLASIRVEFWWPSVEKDVKSLYDTCLHCITAFESTVPRPYGEALHAEETNQVLR
jgi:hypothetical protein